MKQYRFCFGFLVLLLVLVACQPAKSSPTEITAEESADGQADEAAPAVATVATEEPADPWQVVQQMEIEHRPTYAAFMDEMIAATDCGRVNYAPSFTVDGGHSWVQPDVTTDYCPNNVDIVDAQSIWVCSQFSVNSSKDGGQTLEYLTQLIGSGCRLLTFLDREIGWGASIANVSVTKDGANSWEAITLPQEVSDIAAISLRSAEAGYLLDFDGTLYSTNDGGMSWSAQTLEIEDGDLTLMKLGRPSAAVRFLDEDNGVVILNLAGGGKSEVVALHTVDGGQSWKHYVLPVELGAVYLSHDGQYLTVSDLISRGKVSLLKR